MRKQATSPEIPGKRDVTCVGYSDGVQGAFGTVAQNRSIAVDPTVIPPRAHVNIEAVGDCYADDRGSQIRGYYVDNFLGAGTLSFKPGPTARSTEPSAESNISEATAGSKLKRNTKAYKVL